MPRVLRSALIVVATSLLMGALGLASVASGQEDGDGQNGGDKITFTVGAVEDMRTINPLKILETPEYELAFMQYDMLLNFEADSLKPTDGLATDWETSEDGKTWTFTIRDDATWSDGEPVTAHDIAFTYNFMLDENISLFTSYLPYTESITAPDDTTLVWKTKKPTGAPTYPPWVYILPEHVWGDLKNPQQFDNFPNPVTSGPFRITEWERGQFWKLEANEDYWGGAPKVDEIVFRVFKNNEALVQALKKGEIDIAADIPAKLFDTLGSDEAIVTNETAPATFIQMSMNQLADGDKRPYCVDSNIDMDPCESTGHPALLDGDVRTAIAHAIDKDVLVDRIRRGYGMPGTSVIPPAFPAHWQPSDEEAITFDIDEANRILDEAGYEDTDGDGVREMPGGGRPLEFRFLANTEEPDTVPASQFIQGWLRQIGIATNVDGVTESKLVDIWYANDYDMYIWGWGPDPDPDFMLSTFTTEQCLSWSDTCYSNPRYDRLYEEQRTTIDPEKREVLVEEMQRILYEDVPEVVLWYDNELQAYRGDRWTGFVEQPSEQGYLINQYGNYSYINLRPASAEQAPAGGGVPLGLWLGIAAAIVVVAGLIMMLRRRTEEDRA
jgi:peptide/nickel transport system substrate-binding protein